MKLAELKTLHNALVTLPRFPFPPRTLLTVHRAAAAMEPAVRAADAATASKREDANRQIEALRLELESKAAQIAQQAEAEIAQIMDAETDVPPPLFTETDFVSDTTSAECLEVMKPLLPYLT